jgi:hypothetical protein
MNVAKPREAQSLGIPMRDRFGSKSPLRRPAGWAAAPRSKAPSPARRDDFGLAADRPPRAKDVALQTYAA